MKLLTPVLVALALAASCGPPVVLPACPTDTIPRVCAKPGVAECTDGLNKIVGCDLDVPEEGVTLECVDHC